MSKLYKLKKCSDGIFPAKGEWKGVILENGIRSAHIRCPECGELGGLRNHLIKSDGVVNPSLDCPTEGCSFHVWATLEDWNKQ